MGKLTIFEDKPSRSYFNCKKNPNTLDSEKINRIKDGYYRVMDGLHELVDLIDTKELSGELMLAQQALKTMRKSTLENLWMRSQLKR